MVGRRGVEGPLRVSAASFATLRRVKTSRVLQIATPSGEAVSGALHQPTKASGVAVALAPGAGSSMDYPQLVAMAEGLAARGHTVLRFNFLYRERGSRRPDPTSTLVATYRAAADALRSEGE